MGLLYWLPLINDFHNQGTSAGVPTTAGTITSVATGKLGKCYQTGTAAGQITLPVDDLKTVSEMSVCFWLKVVSWNTNYATFFQAGLGTSPWASYIFGILRNNAASNLVFTITGDSSSNGSYTSSNLTEGTWYHLAFTYSAGYCRIYINGALDKEYTTTIIPKFSAITNATIGRVNNGSYQTNAQFNDFRIYSHALSLKEIKEISKGLILHYKLDDFVGGENLLSSTVKSYNSSAYCAYQFNLSENLVANETYTIQFWNVDVAHSAKSASDLGIDVYWGGGSVRLCYWHGTNYFTNGHADYLTATFTVTSANASGSGATNLWFNIYNSVGNADGTRSMSIERWKIEKGSVATDWVPAKADALYTSLGIGAACFDSSGYQNDGTLSSTSPTADTSTARYDVCMSFSGANWITSSAISGEAMTITAWFKTTKDKSTAQCIFGESTSAICAFIFGGGIISYFRGSTGGTGSRVLFGSEYIENGWNHLAVVKTGDTTRDVYCNGVKLTPTTNNYYTHAEGFFIGARSSAGTLPFYGSISDVRIYATALSADDIKELYNTSASIDNTGKIFAREFVEG